MNETENASPIPEPPSGFRSGYAALVGRPNVGKSTLLNEFLGTKIAIVANKPQTTRHRILGVYTDEESQIVFLDTPGIHKPKESLNQFMVDQAIASIGDGDVVVILFSGDEPIGKGDEFIVRRVQQSTLPYIAVLNKIDILGPDVLTKAWERIERLTEDAVARIAISALHSAGTEELKDSIKNLLPEGPMFYPEESLTDRSVRFLMAELVREQVIRATREELPYASTVRVVEMTEAKADKPAVIQATISIESDSQKGMMIGKGGEMLKRIGSKAREEMEKSLDCKVFLELKVEVRKNWRKNPKELRKLGYSDDVA